MPILKIDNNYKSTDDGRIYRLKCVSGGIATVEKDGITLNKHVSLLLPIDNNGNIPECFLKNVIKPIEDDGE